MRWSTCANRVSWAWPAIGAVAGHLFQARALGGRQGVERMRAVSQRFEQAQCAESVAWLGAGTARGDALQIPGWNENG